MLKIFITTLSFIVILQNVESARILGYVPLASYSHQVFFQPLWRELAIRGHEVVVITTDPTGEKLPNFVELDISESYGPTKEMMNTFVNTSAFTMLLRNDWKEWSVKMADFQFSLPPIQQLIRNKSEHFDVFLVEHLPVAAYAFKHRFNCPMIGIMSLDAFPVSHDVMGNAVNSVLYPMSIFHKQENLSFLERVFSAVLTVAFQYKQDSGYESLSMVVRKHFGSKVPPVESLLEETDMLFINSNPLFTQLRPLTPSTINLAGGLHVREPKPLPSDLKKFLDNAKEGVIYFSLGSNVKSKEISMNLRNVIMETLKQIPYKILWKFEDAELPGKPDNVKIIQWAPQQDVLRHKNIKLFITQGGLQSLEEALYSHVPMLVLPFFGDQESNANKLKEKGLGLVLDRYNLKVNDFKSAILEVINNKSYKENVVKLATVIQDQPMKPLEKAVWWTEYVIRHKGAKHLRGPRIPLYQYFYLDVWAFIISVLITVLGIGYSLICIIINGISKLKSKTSKPSKSKKSKRA